MATANTQADARFAELVRTAPFIFTAQVVQLGATSVAGLAPNERLAVVKVDSVFRAPPVLESLKNKRVTIQLGGQKSLKAGEKALFYATSWLYGDGVAVVEVARERVPSDLKSLAARVAQVELRFEDEKLNERLHRAEIVITGLVEKVGPIDQDVGSRRSEHDPLWWRAEIAIDHVEKGKAQDMRVTAYFPSSLDEYWLETPKLHADQRGTFILHREAEGKRARMQPPGPALLDPLDFQPLAQTERVRAMLKLASR